MTIKRFSLKKPSQITNNKTTSIIIVGILEMTTFEAIAALLTAIIALVITLVPYLKARIAANKQEYKYAYVKFHHLKHKAEGVKPAYVKEITRQKHKVDVYDEFQYFKLHVFKGERKTFTVTDSSSDGVVDMEILHPRQNLIFNDETYEKRLDQITQEIKQPSSVYFLRSTYYNGFQPGSEWIAIRMNNDTEHARLIVDFSAISYFPDIILEPPTGTIKRNGVVDNLGILPSDVPGVYEVHFSAMEKEDVLRINFSIDWENPYLNS